MASLCFRKLDCDFLQSWYLGMPNFLPEFGDDSRVGYTRWRMSPEEPKWQTRPSGLEISFAQSEGLG